MIYDIVYTRDGTSFTVINPKTNKSRVFTVNVPIKGTKKVIQIVNWTTGDNTIKLLVDTIEKQVDFDSFIYTYFMADSKGVCQFITQTFEDNSTKFLHCKCIPDLKKNSLCVWDIYSDNKYNFYLNDLVEIGDLIVKILDFDFKSNKIQTNQGEFDFKDLLDTITSNQSYYKAV